MFPEIIIQVGHGKMKAKDIENVMVNFQKNITSILVCSTIIESGIDIPNANTLIVESANKLGLAQLHQLRGRVGRSERQAFTYFLKDPSEIESKANARLDALIESDSLSAGFLLAIKDLEIRGAGEILGSKQSGVIESVGLEMYLRLLNKTVQHLKEGSLDRDNSFIEKRVNINLGKSAYLTSEYLPDINQRILLYSRIANALNEDELKLIQVEMIDRFGLFSKEVKALMIQSEISLLAERKNIEEINSFGSYLVIKFNGDIKKISLKKEEDTNEDFSYLIDYLKEL
jgi:transcription-repair coupling factor (superfamily II helicase)